MIPIEEIYRNIDKYNINSYKDIAIATICSHSALQVFAGAKESGFKTIGICTPDRLETYKAFPHARPDKFITIKNMKDVLDPSFQDTLLKDKVILIPHGSFVEYIGPKNIENELIIPMLGNRAVLGWEGDRTKQRKWLESEAGLPMPEQYKPEQIKGLCLVKLKGAKGGAGFFKVSSAEQYRRELAERLEKRLISKSDAKNIIIQEFITGTRYYHHFFYSPLSKEGYSVEQGKLELMGIDRRDETNVDDLARVGMSIDELRKLGITPTYTVAGNIPLILRESLLPKIFEYGKRVVESSIKLFPPGMLGPFCIETVCQPDLNFMVFEISARIVAGTNLYPEGSPYSYLAYGRPMSTGRRIAEEIKMAVAQNKLKELFA